MSGKLTLYQLPPSPNNMKVRIALGYKGLEYASVEINPMDRTKIIEVSTQPLAPVLDHDGHIVFDSGAILRYLDANFPETPRLFSSEYAKMKEIEKWELFVKADLSDPIRIVIGQFFSKSDDPDVMKQANRLLHNYTECIEDELKDKSFLTGDEMTAADVIAAPFVSFGMISEEVASGHPLAAFMKSHLSLGEKREKTREWVGRVLSCDK